MGNFEDYQMGIDWGKDESVTSVAITKIEEDGAATIIAVLHGAVAEYVAMLKGQLDGAYGTINYMIQGLEKLLVLLRAMKQENDMMQKRTGIFFIIAGLLWLIGAILLPRIDSVIVFLYQANQAMSWFGPKAVNIIPFAKFVLAQAVIYGYREALLLIIAGVGFVISSALLPKVQ